MRNPLRTESSTSVGLLLARLPIGAFFLIAGYQKVFKIGTERFVSEHLAQVPRAMPPWFGGNYLHAVPFAEMAVGLMMMAGLLARVGGFVAALMVLSFTIAITGVHAKDMPFNPNLVYLGITLLVFLAGPGRFSLDGWMWKSKDEG